MPHINWKPEYTVHVAEIDKQHQRLVTLTNDLYNAMEAGQGRQTVNSILRELVHYSKTHFTYEESLLDFTAFPGLRGQKNEHTGFILKVKEFQAAVEDGQSGVIIQIGDFLRDWLINHIQSSDQEYAAYLNARGIQ